MAQRIDSSVPAPVRGNVHPMARPENDQGRMSATTVLPRMVMMFNRTPEQQAELEKLLEEQQDRSSTNYHRWLTPEQFADRFAMSVSDLAEVTEWLESRGFTIVETPPSRTYVAFRGTVEQVDSVFRTEIHQYKVSGEEHFANATDPVLPGVLASVVVAIRGLHDFKPRAHGVKLRPQFTSHLSGNHFLAPDDFATIYNVQPLYNMGIDGTGQSIAVVGQSDILLSDIQKFRAVSGFPANDPQVMLIPGSTDPGVVSGDVVEASLDLEWAGAIARNATIIYVNSSDAFTSMIYAVNHNLAPVISVSYGACETSFSGSDLTTFTTMGQQANAQGQTITAASGDSGAADCDFNTSIATHGLVVDMPAAMPTVTGVGGTTFNDSNSNWNTANDIFFGSALGYIPEISWNDSGTQGAAGGGASSNFSKPTWQAGTGVPSDGKRDVPDVAFAASPSHVPYLICSQGACVDGYRDGTANGFLDTVGGTSAGSPAFAGVVALLNQMTGSSQGNVNPRLYQLAAISSDVFHDITSGTNNVSCRVSPASPDCPNSGVMGFSAGTGYDQVTGLGTLNVFNLAMEWVNVAISPNPIQFGNLLPNIAKTIHVSIRNNNGPTLNISGVAISGNFTQTNNCVGALSFGASCTVNVTFVPTAGPTQNGTLTVTADDSASPHQIPISGRGADLGLQIARPGRLVRSETNPAPPAGSAQPSPTAQSSAATSGATAGAVVTTTAALPNVAVSQVRWMSENRGTIRVTNRQLTAVAIEVGVSGDITQESDCGAELQAGASCEIRVNRPKPDSTGELKITTLAGSTEVRVGAESRPAQ